jgi:hypothetical protein
MQILPVRARLWRLVEWTAVAVALSWCFVWAWTVILQRPRREGVLASSACGATSARASPARRRDLTPGDRGA